MAKTFKGIDCFDNGIAVCINLNTICNLNCPYCFNKGLKKTASVFSDVMLKSIIDAASKYKGSIRFMIQGGEPLLYPKLGTVLEYMLTKDNCAEIEIYTNGTVEIPFVYNKVKVIFSLHPTELKRTDKIDLFINNVNRYRGNCVVLVQMYQTKKAIDIIDEISHKILKPLIPNFIYTNGVVDRIKFHHYLNDIPVFLEDGAPVHYANAMKGFKGFTCNLCEFFINDKCDVFQACIGRVGNVLANPDVFKNVQISHICTHDECPTPCLMNFLKYAKT